MNGAIYATGSYNSTDCKVYNSDDTVFVTLPKIGNFNLYIVKYDTNGFVIWITRIAGSASAIPGFTVTDNIGSLYTIGGFINSDCKVYNSNGTVAFTLTYQGGVSSDVYIVKYNLAGTAIWAATIGGTSDERGISITTDPSGNIYVTGSYASSSCKVFNSDGTIFKTFVFSGVNDTYVVKYNSSGFVQWAARIAGIASERGFSLTVLNSNLYVCGAYLSSTLTIYDKNDIPYSVTLPNSGNQDAYVVSYDLNGNPNMAVRMTGSSPGFGNSIVGIST